MSDFPFHPEPAHVLVELPASDYGDVAIPDKKYDTKTDGIVIDVAVDKDSHDRKRYLVGRRVFFEEYRDGARFEHDGKTYAFIKFEDIRGSQYL